MWCRSAVSFSFLFLVTAPRMRSCACDTASRLCVRTVLCSSAFLSVPLLPSTGSAAGCPALFAGFAGIISESDFFVPFIIGYGLRPSRCGPGPASQGGDEDIPVPAQGVCVHAEGLKTTRGGEGPCDDGPAPVAFCLPRRHRHPGLHCFRRSIPRLYVPLSTLRVLPHSSVPRMTRRQRGSLLLHCDGLAPSTSCRSPGPIRPTRGHIAISPHGGLYAMPSLCGSAEATRERFRAFAAHSLLACRPLRPRGVRSSTVPEQRCRHGLRRE